MGARRCRPAIARPHFAPLGYSIRVDGYRYTEWREWDGAQLAGRWSVPPNATELYDHRKRSAGGWSQFASETVNVVDAPEHSGTRAELSARLRALFRP